MFDTEVLKPGTKCAFYGRHSTDKQNIEMQEECVTRFASNNNLIIIKKYLDEGVSAMDTPYIKRPALMSLLNDAKEGLFKAILVYRPDRLARDLREPEIIRQHLRDAGTPAFCVSSTPPTPYDKTDILERIIQDIPNNSEGQLIKTRTSHAMETLAVQGRWTGGPVPFGLNYNEETGALTNIKTQAKLIKDIFDMYLEGKGAPAIAKRLPLGSYRDGKNWTKEAVLSIIKNPCYAGKRYWGKKSRNKDREAELVDLKVLDEAIIPLDKWLKCQEIRTHRAQRLVDPHFFNTVFLFRGLAYCKACNIPLKTENQQSKSKARGSQKTHGDRVYRCTSCKNIRHRCDEFDDHILTFVRDRLKKIGEESVSQKVLNSVIRDQEKLEKYIGTLKKEISYHSEQISECDRQIALHWKVSNTERKMLIINVLTMYRANQNKQLERIKRELKESFDKVEKFKQQQQNASFWEPALKAISKYRENTSATELRQLLTGFVRTLKVNVDSTVEIEFNHDIGAIKTKLSEGFQPQLF